MHQLPPPPNNEWADFVTFVFACIGIVVSIIMVGLGIVRVLELL